MDGPLYQFQTILSMLKIIIYNFYIKNVGFLITQTTLFRESQIGLE